MGEAQMTDALMDPVTQSEADIRLAKESSRSFSRIATPGRSLRMSPQNGTPGKATEVIEIPAGAVTIIKTVLAAMAEGQAISVVPIDAELTTQQAANLLGVSRPFVIRQLEEGKIAHRKVGRHRRIVLKDLLAFRKASYENRRKVLDELTAEGQRLGIGY
jgi:excisionase family DNA binding protein